MRRLRALEETETYRACLAAATARRAEGGGYHDKTKYNYNEFPTPQGGPAPTARCPGGHLWADNLRYSRLDGAVRCIACDDEAAELRGRRRGA